MSGIRTLRRGLTKERVTLPDGQQVWADLGARRKRVKPGTPGRRIIYEERVDAFIVSVHATKGWRMVRSPL